MLTLKLNQYASYFVLAFICVLFANQLFFLCMLVSLIYYLLFGFVVLIFLLRLLDADGIALVFSYLTCPFLLTKFYKAWHYFVRSQLLAIKLQKREADKQQLVLKYAQKVDPSDLISDKNKYYFYFYMVALHTDLNNYENAVEYLNLAESTPHPEKMEILSQKIKNTFEEKFRN